MHKQPLHQSGNVSNKKGRNNTTVPNCMRTQRNTNWCRSYEFRLVLFSLKTSTAALVRGLDYALQGLGDQIILFVGDTLITSDTNELHFEHLDLIMDRLEDGNLTLNLIKSHFLKKETKFLGFILTKEGVRPNTEKMQDTQEFTVPWNVEQLRGFLGLNNLYSKFSKEDAAKTVPLSKLLKIGAVWKWDNKEQESFKKVKKLFGISVMLYFPHPRKG